MSARCSSEKKVGHMPFVPVLAMLALIVKVVDFTKFISSRNLAAALTQIYVWLSGIVVVLLFAQTQWAGGIDIGDSTLASLNFWALVILGLSIGSVGSVVVDVTDAVDTTCDEIPEENLVK
jgi:hypothetical protein